MGTLSAGMRRGSDGECGRLRLHLDHHLLMAQKLDAGPSMRPSTPVTPEERRGTSGQWQDVFSEDDLHAYDRRVAELASPDLAHWLHNGWLRLPQPATSVECDEASLIPAE